MKARLPFLAALALSVLHPVLGQERISVPLSQWRYHMGDDGAWASPGIDDSDWLSIQLPGRVKLDGAGQYFWLRTSVRLDPALAAGRVWFETGKAACAFELYVDGVFLATHGGMPPSYYSRAQQNSAFLIPAPFLSDGELSIAIRAYYTGSESSLPGFFLVNDAKADFVIHFQNLFNMRVYVVLAVLCLFMGTYFIAQFISRPADRSSLFYALSLIFISVYFYDMGAERFVFGGLMQRAVARASLSASLGFLMLFFMKFFGSPGYRTVRLVVFADIMGFGAAFVLVAGDDSLINTVFNLSLLPVFLVIIFGIVIVAKAARRRDRDAKYIMTGLVVGVGFGIHDIVYQVLGKDPFAWLQGFTFFALNLSVFIAMSARAARAQKDLDANTKATVEQRDRLTALVSSAERLATETSHVARSLDEAVASVALAAERSAASARQIGSSVERQNETLGAASEAVGGLVGSIRSVGEELEAGAGSLAKTAQETGLLIQGFEAVGEGIDGAASFAVGLDGLTAAGRQDMDRLAATMAVVNRSSKEIRDIVEAVNGFAEQTNLLAMNASIEAAHAGSAGRGFAVIAQEIKKLAAASAERASRIGEIVMAIDGSVGSGTELSVRVKDSLERIAEGAAATASRVKEAAAGSARQRQAGIGIAAESEALVASATRMREESARQTGFSELVGRGMDQLAAVAEDVGAAAAEIVSRDVELASQANALRELAGRARKAAEDLAALMSG